MACYHPLKAWHTGSYNLETGKEILSITGFDHEGPSGNLGFVEIPCGRCIGCRLEYSRQWANRCLLELGYHEQSWFVTLTYDDAHVPRRYYGASDSGLALPSLTLCKRDIQLFFKRLRKAYSGCHIRYFGCGEYGPSTYRPHYHLIVFGLNLTDLQFEKNSATGHPIYKSPALERVWSFPSRDDRGESYSSDPTLAGFVTVQPVTWECCAYTARYITKKLNGPQCEFYTNFNIDPPFTLCSRKPGIGRQYYDDHDTDDGNSLFETDFIHVSTATGGKKFRPPRYYHKLFDIEYPEKSAELRATRQKMAEYQKQLKLDKTDLSYLELLAVEEDSLNDRIKSLKREAN